MKTVNCYECKKELKFIDAKPLWNRLDIEPDFLCVECTEGIPRCDDELEIALIIAKKFIKDNQPERSKREDLRYCKKCNNEKENESYCEFCCKYL